MQKAAFSEIGQIGRFAFLLRRYNGAWHGLHQRPGGIAHRIAVASRPVGNGCL